MSSAALGCAVMGCAFETTDAARLETRWCHEVPVESVLAGVGDPERDRLTYGGEGGEVTAVACTRERPADALGDALLPVRIDHGERSIDVTGSLDGRGVIIVAFSDLGPGVWTERKRVYNSGETEWTGWQVTMGGAEIVLPEGVDGATDEWMEVDASIAEALHPGRYVASINPALEAVFFGEVVGPEPASAETIPPGGYIEKVWRFVVPEESVGGRAEGLVLASHGRRGGHLVL